MYRCSVRFQITKPRLAACPFCCLGVDERELFSGWMALATTDKKKSHGAAVALLREGEPPEGWGNPL